jgi:hypothetical protein
MSCLVNVALHDPKSQKMNFREVQDHLNLVEYTYQCTPRLTGLPEEQPDAPIDPRLLAAVSDPFHKALIYMEWFIHMQEQHLKKVKGVIPMYRWLLSQSMGSLVCNSSEMN